jgi:hypothetical protein
MDVEVRIEMDHVIRTKSGMRARGAVVLSGSGSAGGGPVRVLDRQDT